MNTPPKDLLITIVSQGGQNALALLGMNDHLSALKSAVFSLDSHAQEVFDKQLAVEQKKSQQRFEELQMMLAALGQAVSSLPN
jgi:hypothetical protein